jgi:hypothetical protein
MIEDSFQETSSHPRKPKGEALADRIAAREDTIARCVARWIGGPPLVRALQRRLDEQAGPNPSRMLAMTDLCDEVSVRRLYLYPQHLNARELSLPALLKAPRKTPIRFLCDDLIDQQHRADVVAAVFAWVGVAPMLVLHNDMSSLSNMTHDGWRVSFSYKAKGDDREYRFCLEPMPAFLRHTFGPCFVG